MVALNSGQTWISKGEAARVLGVTLHTVNKLIDRRTLGTRIIPGERLKVSGADVIRILEQATNRK